MLTGEQRAEIEVRLREERELALEALREFDADRADSLLDAIGELSEYRFHPADIGTESMEQEKQFLLASVEGRRLYDIDEALRRLYAEPELFGHCARCAKTIPMERLRLIPYAAHCAECQELVEQGQA